MGRDGEDNNSSYEPKFRSGSSLPDLFFYQASVLSVSCVESYLLYIKNPDDYREYE
jgi:hypothetical protein